MRNEQGKKIKAKSMTKREAIPYLEKILKNTEGKKRRRALEIAITTIQGRVEVPVSKIA
jgi:hypothetical protein